MNKLTNLLMRYIVSTQWIIFINLGLCVVIGYSGVELFLASPTINLAQRTAYKDYLINNNQSVADITLDIAVLKQAYLFGKFPAISTTTSVVNVETLPKTHLELKLHGIYYSSNDHTSLAMIADFSGKTKIYHINEPLPSGAILQKIHEKHATLSRDEQIEILNLLDTKKSTSIANTVSPARNVQNSANQDELSPGQLLGHYQHQLQTDPNSLMKLIRISPINQAGRLVGYQINPGQDTHLLARFNLQPGDILTTMNGIRLDNPINGLSVIQPLATAEQINLEILRKGQPLSFSFNVEK
ncbi:MAG: type II secretion system protein GspC [Thioploca sp.]|nr:type II secretion system protein GspC [Thioploca sp.]